MGGNAEARHPKIVILAGRGISLPRPPELCASGPRGSYGDGAPLELSPLHHIGSRDMARVHGFKYNPFADSPDVFHPLAPVESRRTLSVGARNRNR